VTKVRTSSRLPQATCGRLWPNGCKAAEEAMACSDLLSQLQRPRQLTHPGSKLRLVYAQHVLLFRLTSCLSAATAACTAARAPPVAAAARPLLMASVCSHSHRQRLHDTTVRHRAFAGQKQHIWPAVQQIIAAMPCQPRLLLLWLGHPQFLLNTLADTNTWPVQLPRSACATN